MCIIDMKFGEVLYNMPPTLIVIYSQFFAGTDFRGKGVLNGVDPWVGGKADEKPCHATFIRRHHTTATQSTTLNQH